MQGLCLKFYVVKPKKASLEVCSACFFSKTNAQKTSYAKKGCGIPCWFLHVSLLVSFVLRRRDNKLRKQAEHTSREALHAFQKVPRIFGTLWF